MQSLQKIYLAFLIMIAFATSGNAQCTSNVLVESGTIDHSGNVNFAIGCLVPGQYKAYTLTSPSPNDVYSFGSSGSGSSTVLKSDFLTLTDQSNNVLATGVGSINFVQPAIPVTQMRLHIFVNASCAVTPVTCSYPFASLQSPYNYSASKVETPTTPGAIQGSPDQRMARIGILISGNSGTLVDVSKFSLTIASSTTASNFTAARIYYSGSSLNLDNSNVFGSVSNPSASFTVTGNQSLTAGWNYFFVVYDLTCNAHVGDYAQIACSSITVGGIDRIPSPVSVLGSTITALYNPLRNDPNFAGNVSAGAVNSQFSRILVNGSSLCPGAVTSLTCDIVGPQPGVDFSKAKIYYTPGFTFSTANQFGATQYNPAAGKITFTGNQPLANGGINYFWLVVDVSPFAGNGGVVNASISAMQINGATNFNILDNPGQNNTILAPGGCTTLADGNWNNPAIWAGGVVPATDSTLVYIKHNVTVNSSGNVAGNIFIDPAKTLLVTSGQLTTGKNSNGSAAGRSKSIIKVYGTLEISGGVLNVNGGIDVGTPTSTNSLFKMTAGIVNIDPNDGTPDGSYSSSTGAFGINGGKMDISGGLINILDPMYQKQATLYYNGSTAARGIFGPSSIVKIGGGDDQSTENKDGFFEGAWSLGLDEGFEIDSLVIAGGRAAAGRQFTISPVYNYMNIFKNVNVESGAELVLKDSSATMVVTGNLVNNGIITNASTASKYGLIFGLRTFVLGSSFLPNTVEQSISGTGFFKKLLTDPDPSLPSGNIMSKLTVLHTQLSPGLTLNVPMTVTTAFLAGGRINVAGANYFSLGYGSSLPGNGAVLVPTSGTLLGSSGLVPTSISDFLPAGWINGAFKRWVPATITSGQQSIFPTGSDYIRPVDVSFTSPPSSAGYLNAIWSNNNAAGSAGLPLNEPLVTPSTISNLAVGYWKLTPDALLAGGSYNGNFWNTQAFNVYDYSNLTLVNRVDQSSPWTLQGSHIATTGSNVSPRLKRTGLTGFGEFAVAGGAGVIPVSLTVFTAQRSGKINLLNWSTSLEINTSHFILERSIDGRNFFAIAQVNAVGNSSVTRDYKYTDANPVIGINYYRLRIVDRDNSSRYSWVRNVRNEGSADVTVYPNPVKEVLTVSVSADKAGKGNLSITDVSGKLVYNKTINVAQGISNISVDMSNVASGACIIKVQLSDDIVVRKFNKL